jgi:hypothetical protein
MYLATQPYGLGLGDAISQYQQSQASATKNLQAAGAVGAGVATAAVGSIASSIGATGSVLGITGATLSAAVPFIGPALMGATLLVQHLIANSGCGITCIETSEWADQAAAALQQVLDGYFALPSPRTKTQQALAIANYNSIVNQLRQMCSDPSTGNAGKRCISDRLDASACTWRQKYAPVYPGEPNIGECWNWVVGYLRPIQQDSVVPDPTPASVAASGGSDLLSSLESGSSSNLLPLLAIGGLVALAVAL